jgi:hypothetical protein
METRIVLVAWVSVEDSILDGFRDVTSMDSILAFDVSQCSGYA